MKKLLISLSIVLCVSLGAVITIGLLDKNKNIISNKPEDLLYEEFSYGESSSGSRIIIKNPKDLAEMVGYAELIIKGEVIAISDVSKSFSLKEGTPEKAVADQTGGRTTYTVESTDNIIKISDTLKGTAPGSEITVSLPKGEESFSHQIAKGESYIFFLLWNEYLGKYMVIHPTASYFKINSDGKITSIYKKASEYVELDGKSFDDVKKKIKDKVKEEKTK